MVTVRVNTIKTTVNAMGEELRGLELEVMTTDECKDALIIEGVEMRSITELSQYKEGKLYAQNLSSMIPAVVLDPKEGEFILDMAAAPGSKTSQIAAMMRNTGTIIANDLSRQRLYKLRSVLGQMGVTNVIIENMPGQRLWEKYKDYCDRVLLDAPCSMSGNLDEKISGARVKQLAQRQKYLLWSAVSCAKPGGVIVYSTCSDTWEENEEVVKWIVKKEPTLKLDLQRRVEKDDLHQAFFVARLVK